MNITDKKQPRLWLTNTLNSSFPRINKSACGENVDVMVSQSPSACG